MTDTRQRFQGLCLVASEGWREMDSFDELPISIRGRLKSSPFNLCPACVRGAGVEHEFNREPLKAELAYLRKIVQMEEQIRAGN